MRSSKSETAPQKLRWTALRTLEIHSGTASPENLFLITSIGKVAEISPPQVTNYLNGCSEGLEGLRLAPCHTITSEGVVPVFSAEVLINEKPADVLVGVTREPLSGADCIFDPNIII